MAKRTIDVLAAAAGLLVLAPLLLALMLLIWAQDYRSPFYSAPRLRRKGQTFRMIKLRSMVVNAAAQGGTSTAGDDRRITPIGAFVRRFKFDEIPQLWNVLVGDMSLVGPRPQTPHDGAFYTDEEWRLLSVRPGITDFSSIVFSDEGEILRGADNPDLRYQQTIRPWKSRLGLLYVDRHTVWIDMALIVLTVMAVWSRPAAIKRLVGLLERIGAAPELLQAARRDAPLRPFPPPGAAAVESRF